MTTKELRELDAWILEHVYAWKRGPRYGNGNGEWLLNGSKQCTWDNAPRPSTDPAAAMDVLEKCADTHDSCLHIWHRQDEHYKGQWHVADNKWERFALAETLPIAICLFARQLFDNIEDRRPPDFVDDGRIRPQRD